MCRFISDHKFTHKSLKAQKILRAQSEILAKILRGELTGEARREALALPEGGAELLVSCHPEQYSATALARAAEDADTQLRGLWLTGLRDAEGLPIVVLRVEADNSRRVARSLERYGFSVLQAQGADSAPTAQERERAAELLRYIEI